PRPVVMTTSAYDAEDERRALEAGAATVLTRPVPSHELLARVRSLLDLRRLYEDLQRHADDLAAANERLRELQEARDALTHMIIHDLRTPLTNIVSGLQTVEMAEYDPDLAREFMPVAIRSGQELGHMITNLLDLSKLEAGELEPAVEPTPLADLAARAIERVEYLAEEADLELVVDIEDGLVACTDPDMMVRVLVNLVGNAIKFTPPGGTVTLEGHSRDGEVLVAVSDTGEGIPEADLPAIFDKFSQVKRDGKPHRTGTGLGLTFVKMAAEAHGGRVWVQSTVGEGTTFYLTLPAAESCG
ncbi:MAG TPA: hybrid sensor histidine kinase/response regulator, partial [Armatimonadota bacterium]|nr:hybrid sensor histidine kinase/response regulator [Armatimonadota bacterium]